MHQVTVNKLAIARAEQSAKANKSKGEQAHNEKIKTRIISRLMDKPRADCAVNGLANVSCYWMGVHTV